MKYLNIGCGQHYSTEKAWTNIDFVSSSEHVIPHNLLKGIPFEDNVFDFVYHSHVLEHFSKEDGEKLIKECYRVLKPGGIIRVVVPDLELLAQEYLKNLHSGIEKINDKIVIANYNWIVLELFDQTVRNSRAGNMGKYLEQEQIINEEYVYERIGEEGRAYRKSYLKNKRISNQESKTYGIRKKIKSLLYKLLNIDETAYNIGKFRLSGEIHQWMYDRLSLTILLRNTGFGKIEKKDAFNSYLESWPLYKLDSKNNTARIPDSIFIEGIKQTTSG